jgi:hypothetical protein
MTAVNQSAEAKRERFLEEAQKAMVAFELKEREFRERVKQEEAEELQLPLQNALVAQRA